MSNRLPILTGAASIGVIAVAALAWQTSRRSQSRLAQRTADRLVPPVARMGR